MANKTAIEIAPNYTGRVVLTIENGKIKSEEYLRDSIFIATLEAFTELAKMAGYSLSVATVQELPNGA
ncbi:hypothetical protein [Yersinia frederiksenii]|uniref:hypothetical protein n=1 Tax=Yersinia frederiksenii TaxID=29484 RepID=UPI000BFDAB61|nr:hypothetical protein [Yersinia frederiksenii]ATM85051.1 hypothetical protein CRN74_02530 [Yersinia frederiksenii]